MSEKDPNEPVRVRDKDTGAHLTITRAGLPHGNFQELKQDAVDPLTGDFLPPEYPTSDGPSAAESTKEK